MREQCGEAQVLREGSLGVRLRRGRGEKRGEEGKRGEKRGKGGKEGRRGRREEQEGEGRR